MNALRPFISRTMPRVARFAGRTATPQLRTASTAASKPKTVQEIIHHKTSLKQAWLSDPSTYPIIGIMAVGLTWMVGMGINGLQYKDVQLSPSTRSAQMKDWSAEHKVGVMERLVGHRVKPEGLGIDHEKWAKQKEVYKEQ